MEFKDYYAILGISPESDAKTIKSAYRKLARQFHPDVNPGNKEAEEKFKEINEAYQALSDEQGRKKYDDLRLQYLRYQQSGGRAQDFDWRAWGAQADQGVRVQYASAEDLEDLFGSENPYSDFFTSIFGGVRGRPGPPRPRRGRDMEYEAEISLEEAYRGTTRLLQMDGQRIEAQIPRGVRTGSRIRLGGQGEPGQGNGPPGDLYLIVRVRPHPNFEREGEDLYTDVPVNIYTAVLGGEARVPTLGRDVLLKVPPRTQAGRSFRLRGKGMPKLGDPQTYGDLFARVRLVLPEPMSDREVEMFRQIAAARVES
jgi:curved DNA-binding protein